MADRISKQQRSNNMSKIKSKDTSIEVKLRKALWRKGIDIVKTINSYLGHLILS